MKNKSDDDMTKVIVIRYSVSERDREGGKSSHSLEVTSTGLLPARNDGIGSCLGLEFVSRGRGHTLLEFHTEVTVVVTS